MNKKIISWALYDWANSVFFTTVMAGFFPVFFKQYWSAETDVTLSTERLGWVLAVSGFVLAVLSPTLGVVADQQGLKKKLLYRTMTVGVLATMGLYFVPQYGWLTAALLYGLALFMASASCVFYDSLMVNVCGEKQYDFVSSLGFSLGYLGGGLLFLINVVMFLNPAWFGISSPVNAVKISFLTVGVWWFVFSLPLMKYVPEPMTHAHTDSIFKLTKNTLAELKKTITQIFKNKQLFYFVLAYWFYIDGVFTVMSMAVDFGLSLGFQSSDLIKALLITQFVGFPATYMYGWLARRVSNKKLILVGLSVYCVTILGAAQMTQTWHFYVLAAIIGLSQGGVQSLSRSLFAQLVPPEKSGEYFGFFNLLGKFASILGPALIAVCSRLTQDSRQTILSLLVLILAGAYFLFKVKEHKPAR